MAEISRRGMLQAAGLMTLGAVSGCATSRGESGGDKVLFSVA